METEKKNSPSQIYDFIMADILQGINQVLKTDTALSSSTRIQLAAMTYAREATLEIVSIISDKKQAFISELASPRKKEEIKEEVKEAPKEPSKEENLICVLERTLKTFLVENPEVFNTVIQSRFSCPADVPEDRFCFLTNEAPGLGVSVHNLLSGIIDRIVPGYRLQVKYVKGAYDKPKIVDVRVAQGGYTNAESEAKLRIEKRQVDVSLENMLLQTIKDYTGLNKEELHESVLKEVAKVSNLASDKLVHNLLDEQVVLTLLRSMNIPLTVLTSRQ